MILRVRNFNINDVPTKVEWINNPIINRTMYFEIPATIEKTLNWLKNKNKHTRKDFSFVNTDGEIIGMSGYTNINKNKNQNAEFYVMVSPKHHGEGIGTQISYWMFNYAFVKMKINKIYLYTDENNESAKKIYEKAGFTLEGILRDHKIKDDLFINRYFYGLLRDEWIRLSWKKEIINNRFIIHKK